MKSLAALCLLLAVPTAYAQKATEQYFQSLDLNGDGYVSLAEAAGSEAVVTRFDRGDRNRDGKLSPREFANLKNIKVRVAARKKDRDASAAVGGSAPRVKREKTKPDPAISGG